MWNNDAGVGISKRLGIDGSTVYKFGRNPSVGTTEVVIWDAGGSYPFPVSSDTLTVVSDSSLDTGAGTGARTITLEGLDENWNSISETLTLGGLTPVVGIKQFLRIFRAYNVTSGGLEVNQGTITVKHTTSGDTLAEISPTDGQTLMAIYTVPAGKIATLKRFAAGTGAGKDAVIRLRTRDNAISDPAVRMLGAFDVFENQAIVSLDYPIDVPEKTDIWITAQSSASGTSVSGTLNMVLYNS